MTAQRSPDRPVGTGRTVSVVVPVRDDAVALETCLELLARQSVDPLEIVVVDNASSDESAQVARRAGARVVVEERVGIPAAAAAGYDAARGEIIVRLDADSRPRPDWLERATERFAANPDLDALTGFGIFHDLPRGLRLLASWTYLGSYYLFTHLALGRTPLWGSSTAFRRSLWLEVREAVERVDPEVHDDIDLSASLPAAATSRLDLGWQVGVSARSLRGRAQRKRRMDRAWRSLRRAWGVAPPWERWRSRLTRSSARTPARAH